MSNRFKKNHEDVDFNDPAALTVVPQPVQAQTEVQQEEPETETKPVQTNDLLAELTMDVKPKAKSYGFYLDDDVVKALDKLAKSKRSNRSKMLNTLLRKILLEE